MKVDLRAGDLRFPLLIERQPTAKNTIGEITAATSPWTSLGTRWGSLEALSARNVDLAKGFSANVAFEAKLRFYDAIDNKCRVSFHGRLFYVAGVIHDPRRVWTLLFLTEKQP